MSEETKDTPPPKKRSRTKGSSDPIESGTFTVEADEKRNGDLMIHSIPGLRLRSRIDGTKHLVDRKSGEEMIPRDQANHLSMFPKVPGMRLVVNPATCEWMRIDPLTSDEEMQEKVQRYMNRHTPFRVEGTITGEKDRKGKLDKDRMKTLCRELRWFVESGDMLVVKGDLPEFDEIEDMPGRFLLNPGLRTASTQPRYEDDLEAWQERLSAQGA